MAGTLDDAELGRASGPAPVPAVPAPAAAAGRPSAGGSAAERLARGVRDVLGSLGGAWVGKPSSREVKSGGGATSSSEASTSSDPESGTETGAESSEEEGWAPCTMRGLCLARGQVFWLLMLAGFGVGAAALAQHAVWLLLSAALLLGLSSFSAVVLGGDVFQLSALKETVNQFHRENKLLERQNADLEAKVSELGRVASELGEVERALGADMEVVKAFLKELESFTSVQSVSAMLNLYFAADLNRSGHISGTEADILFSGLTAVWDLVPDLAPSRPRHRRLLKAVQRKGLTLRRYLVLARAAADGDAVACRLELEALARGEPDREGSEILDEVAESTSSSEDSSAEEEKEALVPCFVLGPVRIWSKSHVAFLGASLLSAVLLVQSFLPFGLAKFLCAGADLGLAGGLSAYGKLVVVRKALREELRHFHQENERLAAANQELGEKVAGLAKLQRGLKALQEQFHGSVSRAQSTIRRSNASVKMSALAALMHLFVKADADSSGTLDENEVDDFVSGLEAIFQRVENFDVDEIRRKLKLGGLQVGHLKGLVDLILATGGQPPAPVLVVHPVVS